METQTITACPFVQDVPALVSFLSHAFGATEKIRGVGTSGGCHAELQIGSSELMIGGGPDLGREGDVRPMAFHIYVEDTDATYKRAMEGGAESLQAPGDLDRGRRTANVKDPSGNRWYITSSGEDDKIPFGSTIINPYIHSPNSEPVIAFLRKVFGAVDYSRVATTGATLFIGNSCIEIGGTSGIYQPMPGMFYVCLAYADAVTAVVASIGLTGYRGDRFAFKDAWGTTWYVYTRPAK